MKKTYLIITGIASIVLLLAIWLYLLIYGTPKPVEQFFTDFSFGDDTDQNSEIPFIPEVAPNQVNVADDVPLRQLTTRAVIGYGEVTSTNSDSTQILYTEAGTGHVYSIDLITGTEIRLSNITIQNAESAKFSHDGSLVVIRSGYGAQNTIELLNLAGENSATKETLLPKMVDFTFNNKSEILYTEYNSAGLLGRVLNPRTKTSQTLFTVPFQNATIVWSLDGNTQHYIYPKPTAKLPGYLYRIQNGQLVREPAAGNGLVTEVNDTYYVYTITTNNGPVSFATNRATGKSFTLPILIEPSKCAFSNISSKSLFCGYEKADLTNEFPDNWYKGLITFSDRIFEVDLEKGLATQLNNPEKEVGRGLDIIDINNSVSGRVLYFINKNDNTLWMYEI